MLEKEIEQKCLKYVRQKGGRLIKMTDPSRRGIPDRLCLLPGNVTIFFELKTPIGRLSSHQKEYHKFLKKLGYAVWTCDSLEFFCQIVHEEMQKGGIND